MSRSTSGDAEIARRRRRCDHFHARPPTASRSSPRTAASTRWPATSFPAARVRRAGAALDRPRRGGRHRRADGRPAGTKLLIASSDGKGFLDSGEATLAETRKGKQLVNLAAGARSRCAAGPDGADAVAVVGENRKMLVFPICGAAGTCAGQGVTLQRYRDGGLSDAIAFRSPTALAGLWRETRSNATETDLTPWRARVARGPDAADRFPALEQVRLNDNSNQS
jgi:hypothetical protein